MTERRFSYLFIDRPPFQFAFFGTMTLGVIFVEVTWNGPRSLTDIAIFWGMLICFAIMWRKLAVRASNPQRFQVSDGNLTATYFGGRRNTWPLASLRKMPPVKESRLRYPRQGVRIVTVDGRMVFQVWGNLLGFREFVALFPESS